MQEKHQWWISVPVASFLGVLGGALLVAWGVTAPPEGARLMNPWAIGGAAALGLCAWVTVLLARRRQERPRSAMFNLGKGTLKDGRIEHNYSAADDFLRAEGAERLTARGNVHEPPER